MFSIPKTFGSIINRTSSARSRCFTFGRKTASYNLAIAQGYRGVPIGSLDIPLAIAYAQNKRHPLGDTAKVVLQQELQEGVDKEVASTIQHVVRKANRIEVFWADGHLSQFHNIWLRDCCSCSSCFHVQTNERILDTAQLPLNLATQSVKVDSEGNLIVTWDASQNGHISVFDAKWLRENCYSAKKQQRVEQNLWGASIISSLPEMEYSEVNCSDEGLKRSLEMLDKHGFLLVRQVPCEKGASIQLAKQLGGFPREVSIGLDLL